MYSCTVQAMRLCAGCMVHMRSRGTALLFLDHVTRRGWGVSVMPWPFFTPRKDPVPILQEAGWATGLVWTGVENLAPHRDSILDHPACSQSLYRLSYRVYKSLSITLTLMDRKKDFKTNSWEKILIIMTMMSEQQSLPFPKT